MSVWTFMARLWCVLGVCLLMTLGGCKGEPPCTAGAAGCECSYPQSCDPGLSCRWDICWGGAVPPPDTYFYTDRALQDYDAIKRLIEARFALSPGDKAADIGCGRGSMTASMARVVGPTGAVYATDIDPGALKRTVANLAQLAKKHGDDRVAPVTTLLAKTPRDTGLETVPDGTLSLMLMLNSVYFERDEAPEEARAYMGEFLRKLAPGGRLVYHFDWIEPQRLTYEETVTLFVSAGFSETVTTIPMPAHIPESTFVLSGGPSTDQPKPLKRGFIAVFERPAASDAR